MPDHVDNLTLAELAELAKRLGYVRTGEWWRPGGPVTGRALASRWQHGLAGLRRLLRQPEAVARAACYARGVADALAKVATALDMDADEPRDIDSVIAEAVLAVENVRRGEVGCQQLTRECHRLKRDPEGSYARGVADERARAITAARRRADDERERATEYPLRAEALDDFADALGRGDDEVSRG